MLCYEFFCYSCVVWISVDRGAVVTYGEVRISKFTTFNIVHEDVVVSYIKLVLLL